jgi:alcohol dehydrogenase
MWFDGPGRPLRRAEFPHPELAAGEAWVRVRLATVCGSDLHTYHGHRGQPTPVVLGHEIVGEVEDSRRPDLSPGDRVVWAVCVACGDCRPCLRQLPQKCDRLRKYGKEPGGPLGGLATHVHLMAGTEVVTVPPGLPDEVAAPAMCAGATAAACLRAAGPADTLLVTGAGLLGLTAAAMAASAGTRVAVCDPDERRLNEATRFGASDQWPDEIAAAVEMSGATDPARFALTQLRVGGTLVLAGAVSPAEPLALDPQDVVRRCLTIRGVHNYTPRDLNAAVGWLTAHHARFPFAEQVSHTFPLADAEAAFRFAATERPVRVGIMPG